MNGKFIPCNPKIILLPRQIGMSPLKLLKKEPYTTCDLTPGRACLGYDWPEMFLKMPKGSLREPRQKVLLYMCNRIRVIMFILFILVPIFFQLQGHDK